MRSSEDLKRRWLTEARQVFARPGMYARSGPEMESVAGERLGDLCYLDERDDEYEQVRKFLRGFGKLGVHGPFAAVFDVERRCTDEVASVYAEVYHRLGYLPVERLLTAEEWLPLTRLREWVGVRDVRRGEVEAAFGAPSLLVGRRVLCYAPADGGRWVFFDCWDELPRRYAPGKGRFDGGFDPDPLVRDIRVPATDFEEGLLLTLYGRVLRWGPGWWIDHPSDSQTAEHAAFAAQLRQIESADPSQGNRRH
ncbi:hypothetical protein ACFYTQ_22095 [Nocardia sp. NPDC004068]|uniref:hypothetical protein n=1 Tax=Nocardia sp. NPDC004068 TaxID=3364303 RepID=UPI00367CA016